MKTKGGRKEKPQLYSHIASAIIPVASIVAVPSAGQYFPRQNTDPRTEWGPVASTLLRASLTSQMLIPSTNLSSLPHDDDDDDDDDHHYQPTKKREPIGRMDASSDEDESDTEGRKRGKTPSVSILKSSPPRSASLSEAEKRLFGHVSKDEEPPSTAMESGLDPTIYLDSKRSQKVDPSQSTTTTTTTTNETHPRRAAVTITRQTVPPLNLNPTVSQAGPSSAKANNQLDGVDNEARSITVTRSSLNDSTNIPTSARSVSFKEPVVYETYDSSSSSKSQPTATVTVMNLDSVLDRIVIPPPEEYQQNSHEREKQKLLVNEETQQLRSTNRRPQEDPPNRLQTSQKPSQNELNDLSKQAGRDHTKDLETLNKTLQSRCDQLQNELASLKERSAQEQGQSSARELKNENHFLKDYVHRLTVTISDYQARYPSDGSKSDANKEQRKMQGLPMKGPSPIWLLNQKFLAPLFVCYDEKLHEKDEFIRKLQTQLNDLHTDVKQITNENLSLHERVARTSSSSVVAQSTAAQTADLENLKRHAYLVLEENKVLQEQLNLQTSRLTDVQKTQIQEVSNLTRRLMIVENEKTDGERSLETIRVRNEELRKKYEQLIVENDHRMHVEDHVREINEMKRITEELSEKHASEMQLLLRRVQDAEAAKRAAQLKLSENRNDMERLKSDLKATKKLNQKLQIRVQTFEKKLELQQMKEQRTAVLLDKANEATEKIRTEQGAQLLLVKTREDEMNKTKERMQEEGKKLSDLENRLEDYKSKSKERATEVQEQMKKQYESLKVRCTGYEQRIQQLMTLLGEKQIVIDDLNSEKRNLEVDLETIWQTTNADNKRMLEQLHDMRITS